MNLNPVCTRCEKAMTWIGIGPGAEPICLTSCEPVLPGTRCPNCKSFNIQVFEMHVGWGWMGPPTQTWHCVDCGRVFLKKDAL